MRFSGFAYFFTRAESLLELQTFLTNLRLFVKKNFLGSRRAPSAGSKTLIPYNCLKIPRKRTKMRDMHTNVRFSGFAYFFTRAESLLELQTFLTNLRLFVKKHFLGSRRAPSAGSKTLIPINGPKISNNHIK